jgi:hypothetical protein
LQREHKPEPPKESTHPGKHIVADEVHLVTKEVFVGNLLQICCILQHNFLFALPHTACSEQEVLPAAPSLASSDGQAFPFHLSPSPRNYKPLKAPEMPIF